MRDVRTVLPRSSPAARDLPIDLELLLRRRIASCTTASGAIPSPNMNNPRA